MRSSLVVLALLLVAIYSSAQSSDRYSGGRMLGNSSLPPIVEDEDLQAKFIKREWSRGKVAFSNGKPARELPLLFDVYNNQLYYLEGANIMEFLDPVSEFNIGLVRKNDSSTLHFRRNYPAVNTNSAETFYEVLADGNFQLLRCKAKTINLYKNQDEPEERRKYDKEQLYIFTPDKKLVLIRKDKKQLVEALPEYSVKISNLIETNRIKVKSEDGLRNLVELLNKQ